MVSEDRAELGANLVSYFSATCKMHKSSLETHSSIQAELSTVAADLRPWGCNSGIHSAMNGCCTGLVYFKASEERGRKWIIKLILQPGFWEE